MAAPVYRLLLLSSLPHPELPLVPCLLLTPALCPRLQALHPVPPVLPDRGQDAILLFFKLYDPEKETLE
jgi:hypothetical protein